MIVEMHLRQSRPFYRSRVSLGSSHASVHGNPRIPRRHEDGSSVAIAASYGTALFPVSQPAPVRRSALFGSKHSDNFVRGVKLARP